MKKDFVDNLIDWSKPLGMSQKAQEEWEFLNQAKKYAAHDPYKCEERGCLICEALGIIENTQSQIASAEYEKNWDHALDQGIPF